MDDLHAQIVPLLQFVLAQMRLVGVCRALDVACGTGLKSGWLAATLAAGGRVVGLDRERHLLHDASAVHTGGPFDWVAGDAVALPLQDQAVDLVWCSAALGLFGDTLAALRDMRRVLRSGGLLVVVTGGYLWVRLRRWRADLADALAEAYAAHIAEGGVPVTPADGLVDGVCRQFLDAGFVAPTARAFVLPILASDAPPLYGSAQPPLVGEVMLASWLDLRMLLAERLPEAMLQQCDDMDEMALEPELASVVLVVSARR